MTNIQEHFALATNRDDCLKQLVAGSDDHYYYTILHSLNNVVDGQIPSETLKLLDAFKEKMGQYNTRVKELRLRSHFILYDTPARTLSRAHKTRKKAAIDFLKDLTDPVLSHEKPVQDGNDDDSVTYPSTLDKKLVDTNKIVNKWLEDDSLSAFESESYDFLVNSSHLKPYVRDELLSELVEPCSLHHTNLPKIIAKQLKSKDGWNDFGSDTIHANLTIEQLEALRGMYTDVINDEYVNIYLKRLLPGPEDIDDIETKDKFLTAAWSFVSGLDVKNEPYISYQALVLYNRLKHDHEVKGTHSMQRFMQYLKIPRHTSVAKFDHLEGPVADISMDIGISYLEPADDDSSLVNDYLEVFFSDPELNSIDKFKSVIRSEVLTRALATTKLRVGQGNADEWYAMIDNPSIVEALTKKVEVTLVPHNPRYYDIGDDVVIEADIKSVKKLVVKLFYINTATYYRDNPDHVSTDVDLDGLVANSERVYEYDEPPIRCVRRRFEFPELKGCRGVWVIEFVGSGVSSRAVLRKGWLRYLERICVAGHALTVVDEQNRIVKNGKCLLGGHEYTADEDGEIMIPFSATSTSTTSIVLCDGDFCHLDKLTRLKEEIRLEAGIYVDRESLVTGATATITVRPIVYVCDVPASPSLLEKCELVIKTVDAEGTDSEQRIPDFAPTSDNILTHNIVVAPDLRHLSVTFSANARLATTGEKQQLVVSRDFSANQGEDMASCTFLHFAKGHDGQYRVEALGKCGEAKVGMAVNLTIKHRFIVTPIETTLQTDANGVILLGPLIDVTSVSTAYGHVWHTATSTVVWPANMHGSDKMVLRLPAIQRDLSMYSLIGGPSHRDWHSSLSIDTNLLEIRDLLPGDYQLRYIGQGPQTVHIRIGGRSIVHGWVVSKNRCLLTDPSFVDPLAIHKAHVGTEGLVVELVNADPESTRVHVVGTRFFPLDNLAEMLDQQHDLNGRMTAFHQAKNVFFSNRGLGDEQRYVMDRQYHDKTTGMMLVRPSMLLNPWNVGTTSTSTQEAQQGEAYGRTDVADTSAFFAKTSNRRGKRGGYDGRTASENYPALDFLNQPAMVALNLSPNHDGIVIVPDIDPSIRVLQIAAIDGSECVGMHIHTPEPQATPAYQNIALKPGFDMNKHYREKKGIRTLFEGSEMIIDDISSAHVEVYDSLPKIVSLFSALSPNGDALAEFSLMLNEWPTLSDKAKLDFYGVHECHEVNWFLFHHDKPFFDSIIKPFIKDKVFKTVMDDILLENSVDKYGSDLHEFNKLNVVEQIMVAASIGTDALNRLIGVLRDRVTGRINDRKMKETQLKAALKGRSMDAEGDSLMNKITVARDEMISEEEIMPTTATSTTFCGDVDFDDDECMMEDDEFFPEEKEREEEKKEEKKSKKKKSKAFTGKKDKDMSRRQTTRQMFRQAEKTLEYAESNYWHIRALPPQNTAELVSPNAFWLSFAEYIMAQQNSIGEAGTTAVKLISGGTGTDVEASAPFVPDSIADAAGTLTEMIMALAVLALPYQAPSHQVDFDLRRMTLTAIGPVVAFYRQIMSFDGEPSSNLLVAQHYYDPANRYIEENGQNVELYIENDSDFVIGKVYACQVAVTNTTSSTCMGLDMLCQIPRGSVPVDAGSIVTKTRPFELSSYTTTTWSYNFYFPYPGEYTHFPVHILGPDDALLSVATPNKLNVVLPSEKRHEVAKTWAQLAASGTNDEVIEYITSQNIAYKDLSLIGWRMNNAKFAMNVMDILSGRGIYSHVLWAYSLLHIDDVQDLRRREFLMQWPGNLHVGFTCDGCRMVPICGTRWHCSQCYDFDLCPGCHAVSFNHDKTHTMHPIYPQRQALGPIAGPGLNTSLLSTPAAGLWEHLEYMPLINARVHTLGKRGLDTILNDKQRQQYEAVLNVASHSAQLNGDMMLVITYHLLLQDRHGDAKVMFDRFSDWRMQHQEASWSQETALPATYVEAYLDFCTADIDAVPVRAKELVATCLPIAKVPLWRRAFNDMASQLAEIENVEHESPVDVDDVDRDRAQAKLASTEPAMTMSVVAGRIALTWTNVSSCIISYFCVDVELLFSVSPFAIAASGTNSGSRLAGIVKPAHVQTVELPDGLDTITIDVADEMQRRNVIMELSCDGGVRITTPHFSSSLSLSLIEEYGHGVVSDEKGQPIAQTYFKAYAKHRDGRISFLKDGYSDRRGRFDYASLSTDDIDTATEIAVLVIDSDAGAAVKSVKPPHV